MVKEKEKIPIGTKSLYMCRKCGRVLFLDEAYMGDQLICSCGGNIFEKVRPRTRTIILAV